MKGKRILSLMAAFLLAAVTCLTVMTNVKPVYADAGDAAIQMGGGAIAAGDTVYYGSAGKPWRVLSLNGSGGTYSDGTNSVAADSALFLFSKEALFQTAFHDSENNYTNSTLRAELNNRITKYFTTGEKSALLFTTKGEGSIKLGAFNYSDPGLSGDRLFALSANELQAYLGYSDVGASWTEGLSGQDWWLRSATDASLGAGAVYSDGFPNYHRADYFEVWARPAFNLNLNSVLFTSAAAGGKSSGAGGADALTDIGTNAGSEWKVTLKGLAPDFDVSYCPGTYDSGAITVKYSGADGNYISAIVTDSTGQTIKKYGKIASVSGAAGEVTINTAGKMDGDAGDRLFVFCEQDNGDNKTDYASELKKITLPPTGHVWKEATCTEPKTCTICGATEGSANGHSFTYALSEDQKTITATCSAENCPSGYHENGIAVTLNAPENLVYDGTAKEAAISGYPDSAVPKLADKPNIVYYKSTGSGSTEPDGAALAGAPKDAGNYVAQITWGEKTASAAFTITRNVISYQVTFIVTNGSWDDKSSGDKTVTLSRYEDEDLALVLKPEDIPKAGNEPEEGYMAGSWDVAPDTETEITKNTTFTYTYAKKLVYKVIEGANGKVQKGSGKGLTFKTDGDYAKFTGIKIDDKNVASSLYTAKSGSTIVELKAACIDQLSVGRHTIEFLYTDGSGKAAFEVLKHFPVWVGGTQITTVNQGNVLGDAAGSERISFEEKTDKYVLTILTGDEISLRYDSTWDIPEALIYVSDAAEKPLEIRADSGLILSSSTVSTGILNESSYDLTITGDVDITLTGEGAGEQTLNDIYCKDSSITVNGDALLGSKGNGIYAKSIDVTGDVSLSEDQGIGGCLLYSFDGDIRVGGTLKLICAESVDYGLYAVNGSSGNGDVALGREVSITMGGSGYGIYATGTITLPEARTEISTDEGTAIYTPNSGENDIVIPEGYGISTPEDGEVKVIADTADDAMYSDFYTIVDPTSPDVAASVVVIEPYIEVQFVNADEDQTVLATTKGFVGKAPKYTGEEPTMQDTDAEKYTFDGWSYGEATYASDDLPTITEDMTGPITFTAAYIVETKQYEVTFYDEDGKTVLLEAAPYNYGTKPGDIKTPEKTPTKKDDEKYTYEFEGWDPELSEVTGDANYTAKYKTVLKEFTIKFVNEDGKELQSTKVAYGTKPTYAGTTPTKEETAQFRYIFDGWTPEVVSVTGEATYTAKFAGEEKISRTVTFKVVNGAWDNGKTEDVVVTLNGYEGDTLKLSAEQVPAVGNKPAEGYMAGSWDVTPSTETEIKDNPAYTYTYAKKPVYKVIEGADGKVQKGSGKGLTFKTDGDYGKFTGIKIDSKEVVSSMYDSKSGSTVVTLKSTLIDKLDVGRHTIEFLYTDGSCGTEFEVQAAATPTNTPTPAPTNTGDNSPAGLWMLLLAGSLGSLILVFALRRKMIK